MAVVTTGALLAQDSDQPVNFTTEGTRVFSSDTSALTGPSQAPVGEIISSFLRQKRVSARTVRSIRPARYQPSLADSPFRPRRHRLNAPEQDELILVRQEQEVDGLRVYGTYVRAAMRADGSLVHLIENLVEVPQEGIRPAVIGERQALSSVLRALYPAQPTDLDEVSQRERTTQFTNYGFFYRSPKVTRVAIPMQDGSLREGFAVETWTQDDNILHETLVDGNGRLLATQLRTAVDSYNIFPDHPGNSSQTVVSGPGSGNAESPVGWLFASGQTTINISGNNCHAYLDHDNNNAPDAGGTSVTDGNFLASANLSIDPTSGDNPAVAVQNLFYLCNVIHDKLYSHGFVESAGNFQEDNFGNGGSGSDSVNVEAQDGGSTNNANFATPSDGSNPRMQMYLWTFSTPRRDGDLDSDIPWHEYGHGLTWRMIGNMSGPMSGAIGEGESDVLAILTNDDDRVGEYSFNDPVGIRSEPYTNYSRTYGDFTGSSVHFDGEIWAATVWRMWELFQANSIPKDTLWDYIVDGMNFTPSGPAMEDMRDGMLAASPDSVHDCLIWEAAAAFGIGDGAAATISGGPFGGNVDITESFDLPQECGGGGDPPQCTGAGGSCSSDSECCSNKCRGRPGNQTCR
ncbi:MAG TPA: M36 family metallopeptidase [Acidobacteriota bacterium]|nr:M36 family metallopeptidase [Acidobacteriota bacterium]